MGEEWMLDASCRGLDPTIWFPARRTADAERLARAFCGTCPVARECASAALDLLDAYASTFGIWAGVRIEGERRRGRTRARLVEVLQAVDQPTVSEAF